MSSRLSDSSFHGDEVVDLTSVIAEFPGGDENNGIPVPVKKLSDIFDNCATQKIENTMRVFLRIRPMSGKSNSESTIAIESDTSIVTSAPDTSKRAQYTKMEERKYTFTKVFGPDSTQSAVYDQIVNPLLERFTGGESCVLFSYGMTNSGKTYTIQGNQQTPGVFPHLVSDVLERVSTTLPGNWDLQVSMLEIYQDKIFDLLGKKKDRLLIRDSNGRVEVCKLSSHPVGSAADAVKLLDAAAGQRSKSSTMLNSGSSRSHAVYTLTLNRVGCVKGNSGWKEPVVFQVVDLAGAERGNRTKANVQQQREANNINMSLMQLWRCLQGMKRKTGENSSSSSGDIIPFRESKLTHLLMPLLGRIGLNGVAMVTCVNPQGEDYDETISILGNASIACTITEIADLGRTTSQYTATQQDETYSSSSSSSTSAGATGSTATSSNTATAASSKSTSTLGGLAKKKKIELGPANSSSRARGAAAKTSNGTAVHAHTHALATVHEEQTSSEGAGATDGGRTKTSRLTGKKRPVSEESATSSASLSSSLSTGDDDSLSGSAAKRLKTEVDALRAENKVLMSDQWNRETEIRIEVSEEMAMRSAHLLDQIQDLQKQLDEKERDESRVMDVTKSCKKVRRKLLDKANEDMARDLEEAEEELNRVKNRYEIEILQLKEVNSRLMSEVDVWKRKCIVAESLHSSSSLNTVTITGDAHAAAASSKAGGGGAIHHHSVEDVENAYKHANLPASEQSRYSRSPGPNMLRSPLAGLAAVGSSTQSPKSRGMGMVTSVSVAAVCGGVCGGVPNWEQTLRSDGGGGRSISPARFIAGGNNISINKMMTATASSSISPVKTSSTSPLRGQIVPAESNASKQPKKGPVNARAIAAATETTETTTGRVRSTRSRVIRA